MEGILDETLKKAATDNLPPADVLTILAEHEIALRKQKLIKARIAQAAFPTIKTIDAFDFNFPKNIQRCPVKDLHVIDLG